jgi:hypothetical protein
MMDSIDDEDLSFGMWSDRDDMCNPAGYVRSLRARFTELPYIDATHIHRGISVILGIS